MTMLLINMYIVSSLILFVSLNSFQYKGTYLNFAIKKLPEHNNCRKLFSTLKSNSLNGVGKAPTSTDDMAEVVGKIVNAIDEGREEDLKAAGLKITTISDNDIIQKNINNPKISEMILGTPDQDESDMMLSLGKSFDIEGGDIIGENGYDEEYNADLMDDIIEDAQNTLRLLQQEGKGLTSLLEYEDKKTPPATWGETSIGSEAILSPLKPSQLTEGPPSISPGANLEVEEWDETLLPMDDDLDEVEDISTIPTSTTTPPEETSKISMLESMTESVQDTDNEDEEESVVLSTQATFEQLLKVTMQSAEETAVDAPETLVKNTLEAVKTGDIGALSIENLLGKALASITEEMGIDVSKELSQGGNQATMQAILGKSMLELAQNMKELDAESKALYDKLGNIEATLREETEQFEAKKKDELEDLLQSQAMFQAAYVKGQNKVQVSAEELQKVFKDIEDNADFITALAMFPLKTIDKKIAFVLGLALTLKVPFDISQLIALRSIDFSDWLTVFTQSALCFALYSHYGIIKALFTKNKK